MTNYKHCFLLFSCLVINTQIVAQTLLANTEIVFDNGLPINEEFIKFNRIRKIKLSSIEKGDMEVAKNNGLVELYEFNTKGKLVKYFYNTPTVIQEVLQLETKKKTDTIFTRYHYDNEGNLSIKRKMAFNTYETFYYTYNIEKKIETKKKFNETNASTSKVDFFVDTQKLIFSDEYSYEFLDSDIIKKTCKNELGVNYKAITYHYQPNTQRLLMQEEQYSSTWINQQTKYSYNEEGQLIVAEIKTNINDDDVKTKKFDYDSNGGLYGEKVFINNNLQYEICYVNDERKTLKSMIYRLNGSKIMKIIKVTYEYW